MHITDPTNNGKSTYKSAETVGFDEVRNGMRDDRVYGFMSMSSILGSGGRSSNINHIGEKKNLLDRYDINERPQLKFTNTANARNWFVFGCDDFTPYILRRLYRDSGVHNSIVGAKTNMVMGGGLEYYIPETRINKSESGELSIDRSEMGEAQTQAAIDEAVLYEKTIALDKYFKKACTQVTLYGGYYSMRLRRVAADAVNSAMNCVYVEKYLNVRQGARRDFLCGEFMSLDFFVSDDFTSVSQANIKSYSQFVRNRFTKNCAGRVPLDNPDLPSSQKVGTTMRHVGNVTDYRDVYATADYETKKALNYFIIDYLLSEFDRNGIENGFSLDHIIIRYRKRKDSKDEEAEAKQKDIDIITNQFSGATGKRSSIMWMEPATDVQGKVQTPSGIKVVEIPHDNNSERYNSLRAERMISILNAHGIVTSEIVGVPSMRTSGFSNQSEFLISAIEHLYWNRIVPMQQLILDDINGLLEDEGLIARARIKKNLPIFAQATAEILELVYSSNEIREKFGDKPLTEEQREEIAQRTVNRKSTSAMSSAEQQNNTDNGATN